MNKRNFDKLMQGELKTCGRDSRLLLHCCCAPCSSACLERLKDYLNITVLFYNPNIDGGEYLVRKNELLRLINETGWADFKDCDSDPADFYTAAAGLENQKEGGKRCEKCFKLRLERTADIAEAEGFDYFTTTLTLSPLKNAELINSIGEKIAEGRRVKWLYSDFKKRGGYLRSIEISKEHGLYRQNYCGCVYSRKDS